MIQLQPEQHRSLLTFLPDEPAATLPLFALGTGRCEALVDDPSTTRNLAIVLDRTGPADVPKVYLFGRSGSEDMKEYIRSFDEPVEVFCDGELGSLVVETWGEDASPRKRVVFTFDHLSDDYRFRRFEGLRRLGPDDLPAVKSLLPSRSWAAFRGARDMIMGGAVFGMLEEEELVSAAFLTDMTPRYDTLSCVTLETHRRRGSAMLTCQRLMRFSFERGRFPRAIVGERNESGLALAERLGFSVRFEVTSYFVDVF